MTLFRAGPEVRSDVDREEPKSLVWHLPLRLGHPLLDNAINRHGEESHARLQWEMKSIEHRLVFPEQGRYLGHEFIDHTFQLQGVRQRVCDWRVSQAEALVHI